MSAIESTLNLDKLAAEQAQAMVNEVRNGVEGVKKPVETLERLGTKTLGVLQSQGVYAMMLFLFSRTSDEKNIAPIIRDHLNKGLKKLPGFIEAGIGDDAETTLDYYAENVLGELDNLLLVRDLYEQTLIYVRYGAKAAGG